VSGVFDVSFSDGRAAREPLAVLTADDASLMRDRGINLLRLPNTGGDVFKHGAEDFPGNIVPPSRLDPIAVSAAQALPFPNSPAVNAANGTFVASGALPDGGHFTIDGATLRELSNFGGFTEVPRQPGGFPQTATFELFVDHLLIASKDIAYYQVQ